ncbi:MAG: hypothetical protein L0206_03150 [Actinobacteria bacterium]|nr:hypothetical protein [Actinomycetota bacterium]
MPKPITVWSVELEKDARLEDVKGTLRLAEEALVFTPRDEGRPEARIALDEIAKVRRLRGSPVLMVVRSTSAGERRTAFYFVQPPPIAVITGETVERPKTRSISDLRNPRRKARRQNVSYLGVMNREKKQALTEWVRAVRAAIANGSGGAGRPKGRSADG